MSERTAPNRDPSFAESAALPGGAGHRPRSAALSEDTDLAVAVRNFVECGDEDQARERFSELVHRHQRRALRIAYHYLYDAADADEVVQDTFVKVFSHIHSYREAWPFEVWFTRILINACLDRRKARARRDRWAVPAAEAGPRDEFRAAAAVSAAGNPEALLLARERRERLVGAIKRLEGRQRTVFMLCHFGDSTPREVSLMTGLNESTVRVHLFRAARKLRGLLGGKR